MRLRWVSISLSSGFSFQANWSEAKRRHNANHVSISLSSGFSFQVKESFVFVAFVMGFNLVIERLLISGQRLQYRRSTSVVSISLSSGFSFQVRKNKREAGKDENVSISLSSGFSFQGANPRSSRYAAKYVSISLSSGFSFQADGRGAFNASVKEQFQSRYRAASHFRAEPVKDTVALLRFNLVIERLLISGFFRRTRR